MMFTDLQLVAPVFDMFANLAILALFFLLFLVSGSEHSP